MFCHIGGFGGYLMPLGGNIIVPLILWLIKKDQSPFVDYHGKEALNFNISIAIYYIIAGLLVLVLIGFVLLAAVFVIHVVFIIIAAIRASNGEYYRYPLTIRFVK